MAKRGIVQVGQSNHKTGYAYDVNDWSTGHANLWQFKQNGTTVLATQAMDSPDAKAGAPFTASLWYMIRNHLIPRNPGVDWCILPLAYGGTSFHKDWHAPHAPDYTTGGTRYLFAVAQMNAFLAAEAGNTIDVVVLQNGEEDGGDAGLNSGYYGPSYALSDHDAYTRYVVEFVAGLVADVPAASPGGVRSWPLLIGGMPPHICWGPTTPLSPNFPSGIGPAPDGADRHNSTNVPIWLACQDMPGVISNCFFVDSLNPTPATVHARQAIDGTGHVWLNASEYYIHYDQPGLQVMGHRQSKQYMRAKGLGTVITFGYTAPVAPSAPSLDLMAASDTGSSSTDNITRDTTPDLLITFVTTVTAGDILHLYDGGTELGSGHTFTSGEIGSLSFELGLSALSGGSHSLTAKHESAGLLSPASAALVITIDITPATITTPATADVNEGTVLSIALTANKTVTWTETADVGNNFEISGTTLRWTANGTKAYTGVVDAYSCQVTATDVSGNVANKSITVTVLQVAAATTRNFGAEGVGITVTIGSREFGADGIGFVES